MLFSLLTVAFYSASSLGDKFISARLRCDPKEFSFLVSVATAVFLALMLPFLGWEFSFTWESGTALLVLVGLKIAEFYSSAALLKSVSAYELKAWLTLNVAFSYLIDLIRGEEAFFFAFLPCAAVLIGGIFFVASDGRGKGVKYMLLSLVYIASKLFYGLQMNVMPEGTSSCSVLLLVMIAVALLQLPFVDFTAFFRKKELALGALTRIPNALGLWTEAVAAQQNLLLYSLVQPMQLLLLFVVALAQRERLGKRKLFGSIAALVAVTVTTILIYLNRGAI